MKQKGGSKTKIFKNRRIDIPACVVIHIVREISSSLNEHITNNFGYNVLSINVRKPK